MRIGRILIILFRSREHRDEVNAKVVADPGMEEMAAIGEMAFEITRMAPGGFRSIVDFEA